MYDIRSALSRLGLFGRSRMKREASAGRPAGRSATPASTTRETGDNDAARKKGEAAGGKEERARIASILKAPEAKGREDAAKTLALETDLPAATARQYLKEMPRRTRLAELMASVPNPNVGPDWTDEAGGEPTDAQVDNVARRIAGAARVGVHPSKQEGEKS